MTDKAPERLSWGDRAKLCLCWFMAGGLALALVTAIPAAIVGFDGFPYRQFVSLSALVVGVGGAIYGRYPPGFR